MSPYSHPLAWSCVGLMLMLSAPVVHAEEVVAPPPAPDPNQAAISAWNNQAGGETSPAVVPDANGGTRLEWQLNVTTSAYHNQVEGSSSKKPGDFYSNSSQVDLRQVLDPERTNYLQAVMNFSNDPMVISRASGNRGTVHQLNMLKLGRQGPGYQLEVGDVSVNTSTLGASLALRGGMFQRTYEGLTLQTVGGVIAPSWEALSHRLEKNQYGYLRNAIASKVDYSLSNSSHVFVTAQMAEDIADSFKSPYYQPPTTRLSSQTLGWNYVNEGFNAAVEGGLSRFESDGQLTQHASALVADFSYTKDSTSIRWGYHDVGSYYRSLSGMAAPGNRELYLNGQYALSGWLNLSGDTRYSESKAVGAPVTRTFSWQYALDAQLAEWVQGLNMRWQHNGGTSRTSGTPGDNSNWGVLYSVGFNREGWTSNVQTEYREQKASAMPSSNSVNKRGSLSLGKMWMSPMEEVQPWSINLNTMVGRQDQRFDSGNWTQSDNVSLNASAQRQDWGSLNLMLNLSKNKGNTGTSMKQTSLQLDANYSLSAKRQLKLYWNRNWSNAAGATLYRENTAGVQLTVAAP